MQAASRFYGVLDEPSPFVTVAGSPSAVPGASGVLSNSEDPSDPVFSAKCVRPLWMPSVRGWAYAGEGEDDGRCITIVI